MSIGFYFDMSRCTGCRACQIACKDKNRLEVGTIYRNAHTFSVGSFPEVKCYSYSASCNHCESPACMAACPTGAIDKREDGAVILDREVCKGDGACVEACPYGVPKLWEDGKAGKCDSCYLIREAGGTPACVAACPNRALDFGEVEELKKKYGDALVSDIAVLPSSDKTKPNVYINAKEAATETGFTEIDW